MIQAAKLAKLSVCHCGFPVLAEDITLGTDYQVDKSLTQDAILVCGGCRKRLDIKCIWVAGRNPGEPSGFLPEDIFSLV